MFEEIGEIVVLLAIAFAIIIASVLIICYITLQTKKIIFPNFALFITSLLYEPLRWLLSFFRIDPTLIDRVSVEIGNAVNYTEFAATKLEERILILPQCMRSTKCPAKLSSLDGIHCIECCKCAIPELNRICKELGIRVYISPGGTFTGRIVMERRPRAIVGVACYYNLHEGRLNAKRMGLPAQGVPLTTVGCINTVVDLDEIIRRCTL